MNCHLMQSLPSSLCGQLVSVVSCAHFTKWVVYEDEAKTDEAKTVSLKVSIKFASYFPTQHSTVSLFFTYEDSVFLKKV